jgi:hypothetical protein
MSVHGEGGDASATPDLAAELERVRAERDRLRAELQTLGSRPERRGRIVRLVTPILAALTVVIFTAGVTGGWAKRTVLDTDRYVQTVTPLAADPRVQEYLARVVTDELFQAVDVQAAIEKALPDQADVVAAPLTTAARGAVFDQLTRLLQTDAFQRFWVEANRFAHAQVVAALEGRSETVSLQDGKVVLNLLPLLNLALEQVRTMASGLLPADVTLPAIQVDDVPAVAVTKIEQALGVSLPDDFGAIVVFDSQELAALQTAVHRADQLTFWFIPVWVILLVAALWLSPRKRRTLVQILVGSALGLVLVRRTGLATRDYVVSQAMPENRAAVTAVTDQLVHSLLTYTGILLAVAVAVLVVTWITGPYRWAVRLRSWTADLGRAVVGAPQAAHREPVVAWIRTHRDAAMIGGAVAGAAILVLVDLSFFWFLVVVALVGLFELFVFRTAAEPQAEPRPS